MPYIDEKWTEQEKALIMVDEVLDTLLKTYNDTLKEIKGDPEKEKVLSKFKFVVAHGIATRDYEVRPAVKKEIWELVDNDKRKKDTEAEAFFKNKPDK